MRLKPLFAVIRRLLPLAEDPTASPSEAGCRKRRPRGYAPLCLHQNGPAVAGRRRSRVQSRGSTVSTGRNECQQSEMCLTERSRHLDGSIHPRRHRDSGRIPAAGFGQAGRRSGHELRGVRHCETHRTNQISTPKSKFRVFIGRAIRTDRGLRSVQQSRAFRRHAGTGCAVRVGFGRAGGPGRTRTCDQTVMSGQL